LLLLLLLHSNSIATTRFLLRFFSIISLSLSTKCQTIDLFSLIYILNTTTTTTTNCIFRSFSTSYLLPSFLPFFSMIVWRSADPLSRRRSSQIQIQLQIQLANDDHSPIMAFLTIILSFSLSLHLPNNRF